MDYSSAQQGARAKEYADMMVSLIPSSTVLSKEIQAEHTQYVKEAQDTLKGCATHFNGSILCIKHNLALVPTEDANKFQALIDLLSQDTTSAEFDNIARQIGTLFPHVEGWPKWWLSPANASMIFPAKCTMSEGITNATPNTSNPIEHQFSLLHHATGTEKDLILGIKKLHLHMEELHAQYLAIEGMPNDLSFTSQFTMTFVNTAGHLKPQLPWVCMHCLCVKKMDMNDGHPLIHCRLLGFLMLPIPDIRHPKKSHLQCYHQLPNQA